MMIKIKHFHNDVTSRFVALVELNFKLNDITLSKLKEEIIRKVSNEFDWAVEKEFRNNSEYIDDFHDYDNMEF